MVAHFMMWPKEARADRGGGKKPPLLLTADFWPHAATEMQDSYALEKMGDVQEYRDYSSIQQVDRRSTKTSSGSTPATSPYCTLLRAALFGPDTPDRVASSATACSSSSSPGPSPVGTPATGNIFRFKTEVRQSAKRALFQERKRRTRCSLAFSPRGVQDQGRSQGCPTR